MSYSQNGEEKIITEYFGQMFKGKVLDIGAEVGRTIQWRVKDKSKSMACFERGLELLDLTIEDKKNHDGKLKELCILREVLVDYFHCDNIYGSSDENMNNYFYGFNYAAALQRENIAPSI